jgi:hypothetical protein
MKKSLALSKSTDEPNYKEPRNAIMTVEIVQRE